MHLICFDIPLSLFIKINASCVLKHFEMFISEKYIVPYLIKVLYLSPYFDHKQGFGRKKISANKARVISG